MSFSSDAAIFSATYELRIADGPTHQKNWIALEHHAKLLFVETVNPMHVVELLPVLSAAGATETTDGGNKYKGRIQTLHRAERVDLPWKAAYGSSLRGGTNAILIKQTHLQKEDRGTDHNINTTNNTQTHRRHLTNTTTTSLDADHLYLTLFHTKTRAQKPHNNLDTYFMGAMLLCGRPPFAVHAMNEYPLIVKEWMYGTAWVNKNMDYVVYPTGRDFVGFLTLGLFLLISCSCLQVYCSVIRIPITY
jgi:hypothetical protein